MEVWICDWLAGDEDSKWLETLLSSGEGILESNSDSSRSTLAHSSCFSNVYEDMNLLTLSSRLDSCASMVWSFSAVIQVTRATYQINAIGILLDCPIIVLIELADK